MKIIIVAGGSRPSKKLLKLEAKDSGLIIAADSGGDCLYDYGIIPDYIIGDLDSISQRSLAYFIKHKVVIENYPKDKDLTDAQLALGKALEFKPQELVILGMLGGKRADHFLGAFGLLNRALRHNILAILKDDYQSIKLIARSIVITGKKGQFFSLQAYGGVVNGLNITGAKFPLKNYLLKVGDTLTLSNEFIGRQVKISFTRGKMLLFLINT